MPNKHRRFAPDELRGIVRKKPTSVAAVERQRFAREVIRLRLAISRTMWVPIWMPDGSPNKAGVQKTFAILNRALGWKP